MTSSGQEDTEERNDNTWDSPASQSGPAVQHAGLYTPGCTKMNKREMNVTLNKGLYEFLRLNSSIFYALSRYQNQKSEYILVQTYS